MNERAWGAEHMSGTSTGRRPRVALKGVAVAAALAAAVAAAGAAAAEDVDPGGSQALTWSLERPFTSEQRPFAFVVDPSTPGRGTVALAYAVGVGSGVAAERPIPVVLQRAGASHQLSLGYGVTSALEPVVDVIASSTGGSTVTSGTAGLKLRLTEADAPFRVAVMGGALREGVSRAAGAWARAAAAFGTGPLLVEANAYAEHVFAVGRDTLDYAVMAGASWRLAGALRAGVEYVGQDLEEMGVSGAEGGARQAVGPNVAFGLDGGRYQLVAAALAGVGSRSPTALVRLGVLGSF